MPTVTATKHLSQWEAAELLNVPRQQIRDWLLAGKLPLANPPGARSGRIVVTVTCEVVD